MDDSLISAIPSLISVLLLVVVLFILLQVLTYRWPGIKSGFDVLQAALTSVALLAGAYWYIIERRGHVHADISVQMDAFPISSDIVTVEARLNVRNLGLVALKLDHLDARLQAINSSGFDMVEISRLDYDKWPSSAGDSHVPMFDHAEMMWPVIRQYDGVIDNIIEPGETDTIALSFIVSCKFKTLKLLASVQKSGSEDYYWKSIGYISLTEVCDRRKHAKSHR